MKIEIEIDDQLIRDTLTSAFEGGSNYWYYIQRREGRATGTEFPTHPAYVAMSATGKVWVEHSDGNDEYRAEIKKSEYCDDVRETMEDHSLPPLNRDSIADGLRVMAKRYPLHFGNMLGEQGDATTGDVLLQCCLFGDLIYG